MSSPPAVPPPDGAAPRRQTEVLPVAARKNKLAVVKALLEWRVDANSKDRRGWASLHWAAQHNAVEIAELLIANDADVNVKRWDGMTILQTGRRKLRWKIRLAAGIKGDFDANSMDDAMPLHSAAEHNAREVAALLIANNAKLNARDADGWTPLHLAAQHNAAAAVKLLIDNDADVDAKRWGGLAVLYADLGWNPSQIGGMLWTEKLRKIRIKFALKFIKWEEKLADESTPLYAALTNNALEAAELLIAGEANVNAWDNVRSQTLLHWAADSGAAEHVRLLLSGGAKVNTRDKSGWAPLHAAVARGAAEIVKLLLQAKADVNARMKGGWAPLHLAAVRDSAKTVELLLTLRADTDVNARDEEGRTPLHLAVEEGKAEIVRLLLTLRAETAVNARDQNSRAPLHLAARRSGVEIIRLLLDRGADVDAQDNYGLAPLHLAAIWHQAEEVDALLDAGADPTVEDGARRTPMYRAIFSGLKHDPAKRAATRLALQRYGEPFDANGRDEDGRPHLFVAALKNNPKVVKFLLNKGALVNAPDKNGQTPPACGGGAGRGGNRPAAAGPARAGERAG